MLSNIMELSDIIIFVPEKNDFCITDSNIAFPKCIRTNFQIWKIQMECIFMFKGLWKIILNGLASINEEGEENFKKKNRVAVDMMLAAFDKENLPSSYLFLFHAL